MTTKEMIAILASILILTTNIKCGISQNDNMREITKIKRTITNKVSFPDKKDAILGFALVEYKINNKGNVYINAINASSPVLKEHVQNSFEAISNYPVAEIHDTSFICKYVFISKKHKQFTRKKRAAMNSIFGINDLTATLY